MRAIKRQSTLKRNTPPLFSSPRTMTSPAFLPTAPISVPRRNGLPCTCMMTSPIADATPASSTFSNAAEPYFGRVITAMVTPFKRSSTEVDYSVAEQLASHLVANGSDSLVIGGTTGESPTLTWSEQYELFSVVRDAVGDKAKVIAGAGSNSTAEAVEATHRAQKVGLDGTLQVVPYYNKPPQEGLYRHFRQIAECEPDLAVMLYNVPSRSVISMDPDVVGRLSQIDNILGIKQATDDMEALVNIRKACRPDFSIYSGDDCLTLPFLTLGCVGVVSVASHFVGNELQEMVRKFEKGDVTGASEVHMKYSKLFSELFCMSNPIPTKAALRLQGWSVGSVRLPLVDAPPHVEAKMAELMKDLGLL